MSQSIDGVLSSLRAFVEDFDPQALSKEQSKEMFDKFVLIERLGAAGKALTSLQAADRHHRLVGLRVTSPLMAARS